MPLSLTTEPKNTLTLTSEAKQSSDPTFQQTDPETFADEGDNTFENHGLNLVKEAKNTISLTGEAKN